MSATPEPAQAPIATTHDKQLRGVALALVLQKRQLGQALNTKEFAVLVGISYSMARAWFRLPGFPVIRRFVFWEDFVRWRLAQGREVGDSRPSAPQPAGAKSEKMLSPRAAKILAEAS